VGLDYKIVKLDCDFEALKMQWESLELKVNSTIPSISYLWCITWWNVFKDINNNKLGFNKELAIICGYREGVLVLVCPLVKLTRSIGPFKIRFLEFLGQQWGAIAYSILRDRNTDAHELFSYIKINIKCDVVHLRQIPATESKLFNNQLVYYSGSPYIQISKFESKMNFEELNYSKGLRQNIRTAHNRIARDKLKLDIESRSFNPDVFKSVKRLSLCKLLDEKESIYLDPDKSLFYEKILTQLESSVIFILINSNYVSYRVNLFYNNNKICIDASYDRNFKKYEPGVLSVDYNILDSFERKILIDDMGPGLDGYKLKFTRSVNCLGYFLMPGKGVYSKLLTIIFEKILQNKHS
jgi:hypothetical protein